MVLETLTPETDLYDESAGYDDETGVRYANGLTDIEKKQAVALFRLFNELWGLCIVKGPPGAGKDVLGNYLAHKVGRLFPHKRILRDEKPRRLFGPYAGLFNEQVLAEDLKRMKEYAKGLKGEKASAALDRAADEWASSRGNVLLKNSLLYLTEYWKYVPCREPHSPMNKAMGAVHRMKRHFDCLIVGTVQLVRDLDKFTCLPYVDWEVTCARSTLNTTGFVYSIQKVRYQRRLDLLVPLGSPYILPVDAGKPRTYLGDGKLRILKDEYRPASQEERIVLDVIKAGADTYEALVDYIETHGDMLEREILATLKELRFRKSKRVIGYPDYFGLFNSKSASEVKTSLQVQED